MEKKKYTWLALLSAVLFASGCVRLDSVLFSPDTDMDSYQLDNFEHKENWDFQPDLADKIPDSLIHVFTLASQMPDEAEAKQIWAIYVGDTSRIATDTVIVYCHGNAANMDHYWNRAVALANVGWKNRFGVLLMDYRGFGLSEGAPTEAGMYQDVQHCLEWAQSHGLTGDRLVMYGFSLGSAPAVELTANPRTITPAWLITEAPFASAEQLAQASSGLAIPGSYYADLLIDNEVEIRKVQQPFLWLHGTDDSYLDMETHGQVVFDNYQGLRGEAYKVPGAGHGNVPAVMGVSPYKQAVLAFLLNQ